MTYFNMTRTSHTQFTLMLEYMETHGDLCSREQMHDRPASIQHWEQLTKQLNADSSGYKKSYAKWRKVWSDFKNNTKKKAGRIAREYNEGNESQCRLSLTDLERRTLNIMRNQNDTPLEVCEANLDEESISEKKPLALSPPSATSPPPPSSPPPAPEYTSSGESRDDWNQPSTQPVGLPQDMVVLVSEPLVADIPPSQDQHRPRSRQRVSPRRAPPRKRQRLPSTASSTTSFKKAGQNFKDSTDRLLLNYLMDKEKEDVRIKKIQLQQQAQWINVFDRFVSVLEKVTDAYVNKNS